MEDRIEHYHTDQCSVERSGRWPKPCDCGLDQAIKNLLLEAQESERLTIGLEIEETIQSYSNAPDLEALKEANGKRLAEIKSQLGRDS